MLTTFTNTASYTLDLPATIMFTGAAAREFGSASVFVPRSSPVWNSAYLDHDGGTLVEISHPSLGTWRGVTQKPRVDDAGMQVPALHQSKWLDIRRVSRSRVLTNLTAAAIVRQAAMDGLVGMGKSVIRLGTFCEAAPVIASYEFTGQTVYQVLTDMMEATGQEWSLSDDGALSWVPRTGALYSRLLSQDGDVVDVVREGDVNERVARVYGVDSSGREYVTSAGDAAAVGFWPREEIVQGRTLTEAAQMAEVKKAQNRASLVTYTFRLLNTTAGHWAGVRVGDFLQGLFPRAGVTPQSPLMRLLSMSYVDGDFAVDVTVQNVPPVDATTELRAFMEGGASAPPPTPPAESDPTPAILQTKDEVAAIQRRLGAAEELLDQPIPTDQLKVNLVDAWNSDDGFNARHLIGGVKSDVNSNALLGGATDVAGGQVVAALKQATTNPTGTPTGGGVIYVDASTGALTYKGPLGTVTIIALA